MASPAEATPPSYAAMSEAQRDEALRKLLSAALGVAGLGQDATLSYQILGLVPGIAAAPTPDLTGLWGALVQARVPVERGGRLLLAARLQLQRGYGLTPVLPPEAEGAARDALQRAGSEDALWIQVNAALVRALSAGAGVDRVEAQSSITDSIAARRRKEDERARLSTSPDRAPQRSGSGHDAGAAPAGLAQRFPGGKQGLMIAGAVGALVLLVLAFLLLFPSGGSRPYGG